MRKLSESQMQKVIEIHQGLDEIDAFEALRDEFISKELDIQFQNEAARMFDAPDYMDGKLPEYPQYKGGLVASQLNKFRKQFVEQRLISIKGKICIEFEYCKKRHSGDFEGEGINLVIALADALLTLTTSLPLIAASTTYILKKHLLDKWCGCETELS